MLTCTLTFKAVINSQILLKRLALVQAVINSQILLKALALVQRCSSYEVPKLPDKHSF